MRSEIGKKSHIGKWAAFCTGVTFVQTKGMPANRCLLDLSLLCARALSIKEKISIVSAMISDPAINQSAEYQSHIHANR
jgi:hypothetical protein